MEESGYVHCACRDCMDIAMGLYGIAMCRECDAAGCQPLSSFHDWSSWQNECQRPDAYEMSES